MSQLLSYLVVIANNFLKYTLHSLSAKKIFREGVQVYCILLRFHMSDKLEHSVVFQPLSHTYGLTLTLWSLSEDLTVHIMPRFQLNTYCKLMVQYKVWHHHVTLLSETLSTPFKVRIHHRILDSAYAQNKLFL